MIMSNVYLLRGNNCPMDRKMFCLIEKKSNVQIAKLLKYEKHSTHCHVCVLNGEARTVSQVGEEFFRVCACYLHFSPEYTLTSLA